MNTWMIWKLLSILLRNDPLDAQNAVYLNPIEINCYIRWTKSYVTKAQNFEHNGGPLLMCFRFEFNRLKQIKWKRMIFCLLVQPTKFFEFIDSIWPFSSSAHRFDWHGIFFHDSIGTKLIKPKCTFLAQSIFSFRSVSLCGAYVYVYAWFIVPWPNHQIY